MLFRVQEEVQAHESVVKLADDLHHSVKEASDGVYIAKTLLLALQGPAKDLNARKRWAGGETIPHFEVDSDLGCMGESLIGTGRYLVC